MKKILTLVMFVVTFLMLAMLNVNAASASVTGNSTLRAGDTLTLTLKFNATDMYGFEGTVSYDSTKVEFSSATCSNTSANFNYNDASKKFTAFSSSAIPSSDTVKFTFKVKSSLSAGTSISVSFKDLLTVIGLECDQQTVSAVTYTKALAAPISTDATLSSLKITNASSGAAITLNPTFNKNNTSYTANVEYAVSKVNVSATATDSTKATVSYTKSYTLKENSTTTISIKVTAESGATKTYTVKVTRPKDPNYVPSSNANLKSITVTGQTLSPAFSSSTTAYTVDVPFQVSSVKVSAAAQDSKAKVSVSGGTSLVAGQENKVTVTCTAENGTKKVYTIIVKRAADTGETTPPVIDTEAPPIDIPTTDTILTDALTGVTCTIPQDKAPADATFTVQELTSGDVYDAYSAEVPEGGSLKVFNTLMFASGYEIQPSGSIKVTFPAVDGMDSEKARMYTYENGELVEVPFTSIDGTYVWETHRLGTVAIFSSAVEEVADDTTIAPETQDEETTPETQSGDDEEEKGGIGLGIVIAIAAAALVLGAGGAVAVMVIKSKKNDD